jgi:TfuA protein
MRPEGVLVFIGPSLHPHEAAGLLDAIYLPPIKRGDLQSLPVMKPRAVAIVDGEFYQSLAVAPKEVLALIESGVPVYGAASMGALRAAELHPHGMIGVGSVFRLFRGGVLDADDEVALAYCPESYRALSEPLVNTRYALRAAVREHILTAGEARAIVAELKDVYFPERTRDLLLLIARKLLGIDRASGLGHFVASHGPNIKERDARLLLSRMRRDLLTTRYD